MTYSRNLTVCFAGEKTAAKLEVQGPELIDGEGWRCAWSCKGIHPQTSYVYGDDEIGSLYYCLNCIDAFFHEMEKLGYSVWCKLPGDFGGFTFGMRIEDLENANNDSGEQSAQPPPIDAPNPPPGG